MGLTAVSAGLSDVGRQREHNEDRYIVLPEHSLFVVADGMGGHRAGDVASTMATQEVGEFFKTTARNSDITWPFPFDATKSEEENKLICGIKLANRRIFDKAVAHRELHGMGTTVVSFLFAKNLQVVYVAHVGDSRCYRVRSGGIRQLTRDHSLINEYLMAMPELTSEQRDHVPKNVITRALGMHDQVVVDILTEAPESGDVYLLCSDGLSGMVSDDEIRNVVTASASSVTNPLGLKRALETAVQELILRANSNGGEDNVTAVVVGFIDEFNPDATLPFSE
jgi:protein phosphatase